MSRGLRDGVLLGAAAGALWTVAEALRLMPGHPYQLDPALWVLPAAGTALLGALCGLLGALLAPWSAPRGLRDRQPLLTLAAPVLGLCTAALLMVLGRSLWMPYDARLLSAAGVNAAVTALLGGLGVHLAVLLFATVRGSWSLASLFAPAFTGGVLGATALGALVCLALPVRPALLAVEAREAPRAGAPNVLLIVLDTVRADHLGAYGYARPTSPRLDALAADGVLFEQAFAAAPWTLPSHASLFTGLHPQTHGTGWEHPRLHDGRAGIDGVAVYDFPVLAEELAMRGYATFGASNKSWIRHQTGLTQGFAEYHDLSQPALADAFLLPRLLRRYTAPPEDLALAEDKGGRRLVDGTLAWLDRRPADRPFFAFLNLNEAHDPYYPPREFWARFLPEGVAVEDTKPRALDQSTEYRRANWEGRERYSAEQVEVLKALYDAEILYQDGLLGQLFDGLQARGLRDDTLVIITSDHGEEFLETGNRIGHQMSLSDRLVRVPLVMSWPGGLPAGRRVASMASLVDVFPTVLRIAAGEPEGPLGPPVEGVSLLPAVRGEAPVRDLVIAHYDNPASFLSSAFPWDPARADEFALAPLMRRITMLRGAGRKYLEYGDGLEALVDLAADPLETTAELPIASAELRALAGQYRLRLMQQLNDHRRRHETVFGHIHAFRAGTVDAAGPAGVPAHELGYAGGDGEAPATAAEALAPFLGFD